MSGRGDDRDAMCPKDSDYIVHPDWVKDEPFGARSGHEAYNAKFTEREAKVIRGLYKMGATQAEIGELFGVRQANISDIVRGKCYKER